MLGLIDYKLEDIELNILGTQEQDSRPLSYTPTFDEAKSKPTKSKPTKSKPAKSKPAKSKPAKSKPAKSKGTQGRAWVLEEKRKRKLIVKIKEEHGTGI